MSLIACSKVGEQALATEASLVSSSNGNAPLDLANHPKKEFRDMVGLIEPNLTLADASARMEEESNAMFGTIYEDKPVFDLVESHVVYTLVLGVGQRLNEAQVNMWLAQVAADGLKYVQSRGQDIFAIDFVSDSITIEGNLAKVPVTFYNYASTPTAGTGVPHTPFTSGVSNYCEGAAKIQERFNRHYSQKPGALYYFSSVSFFSVSGASAATNKPCGRHYLYNWFCYGQGAYTNYSSPLTASEMEYLYSGLVDQNGPYGGTLNAFYENLSTPYNGEKVLLNMQCKSNLIAGSNAFNQHWDALFFFGEWKKSRTARLGDL
ncbi:MAG TPA: hypothetical protein VFV37_03245 [Luteibaculaceae bacterium]|nr:hypothetical protein [Luteibaculaceae bacterium]